jgi:hypothetical protein
LPKGKCKEYHTILREKGMRKYVKTEKRAAGEEWAKVVSSLWLFLRAEKSKRRGKKAGKMDKLNDKDIFTSRRGLKEKDNQTMKDVNLKVGMVGVG